MSVLIDSAGELLGHRLARACNYRTVRAIVGADGLAFAGDGIDIAVNHLRSVGADHEFDCAAYSKRTGVAVGTLKLTLHAEN